MKRIKQLKIKNFKAFQQEEVFDFKGKNVLVYGNNGSGKSSLFWALYTFLQSSIKSDDSEVQKYFKYFDSSDIHTHQSLLNVFMGEDAEAYIEMTSIDDTQVSQTHKISMNTINTRGNDLIQELNLASDFINYKLLHNFYNASHRQEVNLWPVFERDIFPFITEDISLSSWLDHIKSITLDVPKTPGGYVVSNNSHRKNNFILKLDDLNTRLDGLLDQIETNANTFLKEHFFLGKDVIKISLKFEKRFDFEKVKQQLWQDNFDAIRSSALHIKLIVEVKDENQDIWKEVHRVQSFLNEAQLTRIAIAIRIGALRTRVQNTDFKILVLDDMLNSLDMANRVDVIRIILNKENKPGLSFFDNFQKIILTHDKGFFNIIRRHTDEQDWIYYKFTKDETKNDAPAVKEDLTSLQKAQRYFDDGEFEACGNELRKEGEAILDNFLDPEMKKVNEEFESLSKKIAKAYDAVLQNKFQKFNQVFVSSELELEKIKKIKEDIDSIPDTELSDVEKNKLKSLRNKLFNYLIKAYEVRDVKLEYINQTKEILDRVLNAASHHNDNPLHSTELREAISHMANLKQVLEGQ